LLLRAACKGAADVASASAAADNINEEEEESGEDKEEEEEEEEVYEEEVYKEEELEEKEDVSLRAFNQGPSACMTAAWTRATEQCWQDSSSERDR